jgi:anaerobic magnesium-protoporphyrin IX monomethyl ester cyclase
MTLFFNRILFLICPTGAFCREDRCQSFFNSKLIPTMRPPLEECEAAGAIYSAGADVTVIDAPALKITDKEIYNRIKSYNPDMIVLSITFGSLDADLKWVKKIKKLLPNIKIGLRGAPCYTWFNELLLNNCDVDFCMRGDYEVIFFDILEKGIENSRGIVARVNNGEIIVKPQYFAPNLDELPFADRRCIDPSLYRVRVLGAKQATVRVQRGCPFPCSYCLVHTVSGSKARHRSPRSIVHELNLLKEQGINFFYFRADTFSVNRNWALELSELIATECPKIKWVTTTRVECIDDELLKSFKNSGCYGLSFGIDVASAEIAKRVNKPLNLTIANQAIELCNKHHIISLAYIMLGFLWDTRGTLKESAEFIHALRPDLLTLHYAYPYPGTSYYNASLEAGVNVISLYAQAEPAFNLDNLTAKEIINYGNKMLTRHYLRPQVVANITNKITRLGLKSINDFIKSKFF